MVQIMHAEFCSCYDEDEKGGQVEGQVVEKLHRDSFGDSVRPRDVVIAEVMCWIALVGISGLYPE